MSIKNNLFRNKKIKVLFFISSLEGGGAEKVMVNIVNNLDRNKFDVSLVLSEKKGKYLNELSKDIKVYGLIKINSIKNRVLPMLFYLYMNQLYRLYKIIKSEKPDIVVSFLNMPNLMNILIKSFVRKTKAIICVHSFMSIEFEDENFLIKMMSKLFYSKTDEIVCVSKASAKDINKSFDVPKNKIIAIYNPHDLENIDTLKNEKINDNWFKNDNPKILAVGSLIKIKGYKYLLRAFKIVRASGIPANLIILGEGEERPHLERLVRDLDLESCVILPGFKKNPYKYMKNSDVFVLSSLSEGLPNVVIEAMACGVPVISTRCPSGPEEIITNKVNGILVPVKDEKALAESIVDLLKNKDKAKRLSEEGVKRAEYFDAKKIVRQYEKIFKEI